MVLYAVILVLGNGNTGRIKRLTQNLEIIDSVKTSKHRTGGEIYDRHKRRVRDGGGIITYNIFLEDKRLLE